MMHTKMLKRHGRVLLPAALFLLCWAFVAQAKIDGLSGTSFNFTAKADHITTGEGNSVLIWGYSDDGLTTGGRAQYPGPTLIINQGTPVTIGLTNNLPVATSIVFPGADSVVPSGGTPGLLTSEAAALSGTVSYTVTYNQPGTYTYYSGTDMDLQVEMGLVGAIVVRPSGFDVNNPQAYGHADSAYNYEYLFLLTDMDPTIHDLVEFDHMEMVDMTKRFPVYWFINGRNGPDTLLDAFVAWLPTQPYNCLPRIHPGEKLLLRLVGGGLDGHPYHTHGNNIKVIAKDGRLLSTNPVANGADLAFSDFTQAVFPGETFDAVFTWTGYKGGWDVYGNVTHSCVDGNGDDFDDTTWEYCPDHGKPFPVTLPGTKDLTFSPFYSGSPFLGGSDFLPPGEGGFNLNGGFYYMWHSHNEKELTNFDIFPGGMLTFLIVEPPEAITGQPTVPPIE